MYEFGDIINKSQTKLVFVSGLHYICGVECELWLCSITFFDKSVFAYPLQENRQFSIHEG